MTIREREEQIRRLFTPALAEALLPAAVPECERRLKAEVNACIGRLPPICHELMAATPADDAELRVARELCDYRMPLMDGSALPMGLPYDWYYGVGDDHLGGRAPAYIVPRIAFAQTLARAHRRTGERVFAEALRNYIADYVSRYWADSARLPARDNWLCTACRCGTWHCTRFGGIHAALRNPALLDVFSFDDLLAVFRAIDNMMTGLIPNLALGSNWRVHELSNIFTQGFSYPFLRHSALWLELAVNGLNEEFAIQIRDDGSHEEPALHYGSGTWLVFVAYHVLAAQAPGTGLRFDPGKMGRAMDYFLSACKPFGLTAAIGDDYASRTAAMLDGVSAPHRNGRSPAWDGHVRQAARLLGPLPGFPTAAFVCGNAPAPAWQSRFHADSGHLFLRDGWQPESLYANLNMGAYANCHCHYGLLGIELAGYGRELVSDPGCSALDPRPVNQNFARTRAHSTMCVDGLDQQVAAPVRVSRLFLGNAYDFAVGVYKGGYTIGNPYGPGCTSAGRFDNAFSGSHFRHLLFVKGSYWVVFDALSTRPGHTAETRFQFLPNPMRELPGGGYATGWSEANLAVRPLHWDGWRHALIAGQDDPIEGWMPRPGGDLIPAPVLRGTCPTDRAPCWHGTLFFPYPGAQPPTLRITPLPVGEAGFGYRIETDAYTDYLFCSNSWNPADIALDAIQTNAPFLHLRLRAGRPAAGFACEGTSLSLDGATVFRAPGTMLAREFTFAGAAATVTVVQNPRHTRPCAPA